MVLHAFSVPLGFGKYDGICDGKCFDVGGEREEIFLGGSDYLPTKYGYQKIMY